MTACEDTIEKAQQYLAATKAAIARGRVLYKKLAENRTNKTKAGRIKAEQKRLARISALHTEREELIKEARLFIAEAKKSLVNPESAKSRLKEVRELVKALLRCPERPRRLGEQLNVQTVTLSSLSELLADMIS